MYAVEDFHSTDCYLGDLVGFYMVETHLSPCIQVQTLSYNGSTATNDSANSSASTPTTPRKRRLGEALSTPILSGSARSPTLPTVADPNFVNMEVSLTDPNEGDPSSASTASKPVKLSRTGKGAATQ
jgi:hypothetical protein